MSQHAEGGSQSLLGETLGSMILDSGCSRSVCGLKWFNCYLDTLPTELRKHVKVSDGRSSFKFGNGEKLKSLQHILLTGMLS